MNRKAIAAAVGVLIAGLLVWLFAIRGGSETTGKGKTGGGPVGAGFKTHGKSGTGGGEAEPDPSRSGGWDVDPPGHNQLEGQVLDDNDAPVKGAEVQVSSAPARTATTGDDGTFVFANLVKKEYAVTARSGDLVGGPVMRWATPNDEPVIIRLRRGAALAVHVVTDADGTPVAGAVVSLRGEDDTRSETTGADGVATLHGVRPGWKQVIATATGYAAADGGTLVNGGNTVELTVIMRKGAAVSGKVVDTSGTAVAGAYVTRHDASRLWFAGNLEKDAVQTGTDGTFTFPAVPAGSFRFTARNNVLAPGNSPPVSVDGSNPTTDVLITMKPGGVLTGTVVDKSGAVVANATVTVAPKEMADFQNWGGMRKITADDAGAFELKALPRENVRVRAESDVAASAIEDVDLATVDHATVKLTLDVSGTIAGVVVDSAGEPVPEVQVAAIKDMWGGDNQDFAMTGFASATTDGGGGFSIHGLADGNYQLSAHRTGMSLDEGWGQKGTQAKTGDTKVRLTLPSPGSIIGKLELESGDAPKLATVSISWNKSQPSVGGNFKLDDVTPGKYDVTIRGPEFAEKVIRDVEVVEGKPADAGTIKLVRGRRLVGTVVDSNGAPVVGAHVRVGKMIFTEGSKAGADDPNLDNMMGHRVAITGSDGSFAIVGIPKDSTSIVAEHAQLGRSDALKIPAGTDDPPEQRLVLHGFGSIVGTVTMKGVPVQAMVMATPKTGGMQMVTVQSGEDGSFVIDKVSEGTHRLSAMKMAMAAMTSSDGVDVTVKAGQQVKMDLQIPLGDITLSIEIKPKAGATVNAAQVLVFRGVVAAKSAKDLMDSFAGGGPNASGMKFWMGTGTVDFPEQLPGRVSVCSIPITGDMHDPQTMQRIQSKADQLAVYCMSLELPANPKTQKYPQELPQMNPITDDDGGS